VTTSRLLTTLAAISDPYARELRLGSELRESPVSQSVRALDSIIGRCGGVAASAEAGASPEVATLALASWLCREGESELVVALRNAAFLESQRRLLRVLQPEPGAESGAVPERDSRSPEEIPAPDYGLGRDVTLGERRTIARQSQPDGIRKLAADPHPRVVRELLTNPHLTEAGVIQIVARRPAIRETLVEVVLSPKWLARPRVRLTIILNPGSPVRLSAPLVPLCNRADLRLIARSPNLPDLIREAANHTRIDRLDRDAKGSGKPDGTATENC
jgi:hypothetical protein